MWTAPRTPARRRSKAKHLAHTITTKNTPCFSRERRGRKKGASALVLVCARACAHTQHAHREEEEGPTTPPFLLAPLLVPFLLRSACQLDDDDLYARGKGAIVVCARARRCLPCARARVRLLLCPLPRRTPFWQIPGERGTHREHIFNSNEHTQTQKSDGDRPGRSVWWGTSLRGGGPTHQGRGLERRQPLFLLLYQGWVGDAGRFAWQQ